MITLPQLNAEIEQLREMRVAVPGELLDQRNDLAKATWQKVFKDSRNKWRHFRRGVKRDD